MKVNYVRACIGKAGSWLNFVSFADSCWTDLSLTVLTCIYVLLFSAVCFEEEMSGEERQIED